MNSSIMTSFRGPAACAALYCLLALLCMGVASETQAKDVSMNTDMQHGLMRKKAHGDLDTVWKRLLDTLTAAKAPVFATVDHRANAQGAGLDMTGARVVIFGNPAVGTALMQPVALVCIGGLLYATLMTLLVVPCMYDILSRRDLRKVNEEELQLLDL